MSQEKNPSGVVIKLGGSIVTEKRVELPRVRVELVRRLAQEIAASAIRPLVIVHGAGSFGHQIVHRTGIHLGLSGDQSRLDLGETQRLQYELNSQIAEILLDAGLPTMPCQASALAVMHDGKLEAMNMDAIRLMVDQGMIPLLYGVPAMDRVCGCSILSGDQIGPFVAVRLGVEMLIHATDVDGVFETDPTLDPSARRIDRIDRESWDEVHQLLSGSQAVDVTGGMAGKLEALVELARDGLRTRIIDATLPGHLANALDGGHVGTLVEW